MESVARVTYILGWISLAAAIVYRALLLGSARSGSPALTGAVADLHSDRCAQMVTFVASTEASQR